MPIKKDISKNKPPKPPESRHALDVAIDSFFDNDARLRTAMSRNMKVRNAQSQKVAARVKEAFGNFSPSKYSAEERASRHFVGPGDDVEAVKRKVLNRGVEAFRASTQQRALRVHLDSELGRRIKAKEGGSVERLDLGELIAQLQSQAAGPIHATPASAFTQCRAEQEAQRRIDAVMGTGKSEPPGTVTPAPASTEPAPKLDADAFVSQQVRTQMGTATSPEEQLLFSVPTRANPQQTAQAIQTFELRAGPADVTSYHDFNSLQIAFEHVWAEIFDGRLAKLGQELYHEYVKLQEFVGAPAGDRRVDTIDDLKALMDEIRALGRLSNADTPADLRPSEADAGSTSAPLSTETIVDGVQTALDPASVVTNAIGNDTVAAIINPGGAIINVIADLIKGTPQVKWSSFPGPLPGNGGMITATIEHGVVPEGTVEIVLQTAATAHGWKGLHFFEVDSNNRPTSGFWIANDPRDPGVWQKDSYNRLPLYTSQLVYGILEFWHEGYFTVHGPCYVMANLGEKLTDRSRVTFTWTKD